MFVVIYQIKTKMAVIKNSAP